MRFKNGLILKHKKDKQPNIVIVQRNSTRTKGLVKFKILGSEKVITCKPKELKDYSNRR